MLLSKKSLIKSIPFNLTSYHYLIFSNISIRFIQIYITYAFKKQNIFFSNILTSLYTDLYYICIQKAMKNMYFVLFRAVILRKNYRNKRSVQGVMYNYLTDFLQSNQINELHFIWLTKLNFWTLFMLRYLVGRWSIC